MMRHIENKINDNKIFWWGIAIFTGITIRFVLMALGHNFDFDSYCIVGELAASGKNIYANTGRYNYGPICFIIMGMFYKLASHFTYNIIAFRILIVSTLTLADIAITRFISRKAGAFWGMAFFLNPISLIITGYHNQFDNVALALGLYGILCLEKVYDRNDINFCDITGIILLSLSFITKHILWIFPLWILLDTKVTPRKKFLYAFIPPVMFLMSFVPYWAEGSQGIIHNVFMYRSINNFPLFALRMLNYFGLYIPFQRYCIVIFALLMLYGAYIFRDEGLTNLFMLYTISLVCFSSAMANQYIVIPCMAIIMLLREKSMLYFAAGAMHLLSNGAGLHIPYFLERRYNIPLITFTKYFGNIMYIVLTWILLYYLIDYYRNRHA